MELIHLLMKDSYAFLQDECISEATASLSECLELVLTHVPVFGEENCKSSENCQAAKWTVL